MVRSESAVRLRNLNQAKRIRFVFFEPMDQVLANVDSRVGW